MEQIKIGWGREIYSLDEPVLLPGQMYMRVSEGIHDPLTVTALCLDGGAGQDCVIFCTLDIVVLRNGVIDLTVAKVREKHPEIPEKAIIMGATHTHAGITLADTPEVSPDGKKIYPGSKCREHIVNQCAKAICTAWENRKPGGIAFGYGYAVVAHSRRVAYFEDTNILHPNPVAPNGRAIMYGETNDPQFSDFEAGADHFVNALYTVDEAGKLTGIVCNIPCPSQLFEHQYEQSADYWHNVRESVKKEFGEDVYLLPQCAAAGDLSPRLLHYKAAQQRRMDLKYGLKYDYTRSVYDPNQAGLTDEGEHNKIEGERRDIAERVLKALHEIWGWAQKEIATEVPLTHVMETVELDRRMITDEEVKWCEDSVKVLAQDLPRDGDKDALTVAVTKFNAIRARNERAIQRYKDQQTQPTIATKIHVLRVGEIAFASNRFELYMDYMHRIQARSPFIQTFIIQLAGDEGGSYLATQRGREDKGYSASLFCNQVSPEGGQQLVEETLRVLNEINA